MSLEDVSKREFNLRDAKRPNADEIHTGCLQRIATATEAMANNYQKLIDERDMLSRWNKEKNARIEKLNRSNAALRGQITKLKKKLNQGEIV